MSKLVRILLGVAFLIFLAGVVWSFWAIKNKPVITTQTNNDTQTTITTSTTTQAPAAVTPNQSANQGIVNKPAAPRKSAAKQTVTYTYEETTSSASAWARAGVNADGSTYAEAHAD